MKYMKKMLNVSVTIFLFIFVTILQEGCISLNFKCFESCSGSSETVIC